MGAIVFDFFGTLVEYEPERTGMKYPQSLRLVRSWGVSLDHGGFVAAWNRGAELLVEESARTLREFSMPQEAAAFADVVGLSMSPEQAVELGKCFLREWRQHVRPVDGAADMLRRLAETHRVAIVSNTHDSEMVPGMIAEMGATDVVHAIVLSIDHGWCKPHPSIYAAALEAAGTGADDTVFVGDSFDADYTGPERAGMTAYLIDPTGRFDVPDDRRLADVLAIEAVLATTVSAGDGLRGRVG